MLNKTLFMYFNAKFICFIFQINHNSVDKKQNLPVVSPMKIVTANDSTPLSIQVNTSFNGSRKITDKVNL